MNEGPTIEAGYLKELRSALEKVAQPPWFIRASPTDDGLSVIEDGRAHGMFPVTGERFEIELIVLAINALPQLLVDAKLGQLIREGGEAVKEVQNIIGCFEAAEAEGLTTVLIETSDERLKDLVERRLLYAVEHARAVLRTLKEMSDG